MLRFRLLGIPFTVMPYFWIFSLLLGANQAHGPNAVPILAVWVACAFVSIVVHELGHAFAARRYGLQPEITLVGMGGLTSFPSGVLTRTQHIAVTIAGPAAGFVLYLIVRVFWHRIDSLGMGDFFDAETTGSLLARQAVDFLLFMNLYWTLLNLLPVLPLDGGQILRDVLGPRLLGTARLFSVVCAIAVAVFALTHGQQYLAFFFGYLAYVNFQGDRTLPGGTGRGRPF